MTTENKLASHTNSQKGSTDEITVKDLVLRIRTIFRYLLKKKFLIAGFMLIGAIAGYFYAKSKKTTYTAATTFVLEGASTSGSLLGQYAGLAAMAGINVGDGEGMFQGENLLELYKSRSMLEKALLSEIDSSGKKYLLIDKFLAINKNKKKWKGIEFQKLNFKDVKGQNFTRYQDSVIKAVVKDLNEKYLNVDRPNKQVGIVSVQVTSESESFAKEFNEQIVKTVNDFYTQTKTKKALENLAILQHQADSVKRIFNNALYETVAVADATPNLNPNKQLLRAPAQRSQFSADANRAILSQLIQNLEVAKITLRKETPLLQIIDKPTLPLDKNASASPSKWAILGAFALGLLTIFVLLVNRFFKNAMVK